MTISSFSDLDILPALLENLVSLNYQQMTDIQARSLPDMLAGLDVLARARTGSGKTAAFGLALLNRLDMKHFAVQALVLCPTRELADQVANEIRKLARSIPNIKVLTLCGGVARGPQLESLHHGAHIIVGTPGRILDHLQGGQLRVHQLKTLVLDEADRMLDMGFSEQLDAIVKQLPAKRQNLLFSATYPANMQTMAKRISPDARMISAEHDHDADTIEQRFYRTDNAEQRLQAVKLLLLQHRPQTAIVFCNTRQQTKELVEKLSQAGFSAQALHGDLEQRERDQTLICFANHSISVLVATDVAARGIDIKQLDMVINYQLAHDTDSHTHRIGRTGRAGNSGIACTLIDHGDTEKLALLSNDNSLHIDPQPLPPTSLLRKPPEPAPMRTIQIDGGKKQKLRAGDIVGALTAEGDIDFTAIGKIQLNDRHAFVAIQRELADTAIKKLSDRKMKGRSFRVRMLYK